MTHRARQRLRIAFVVVVCLLFQQVALASYLCPMEQMPVDGMSTMAGDCAEMGVEQAGGNPGLCENHCNPDHSVAADVIKLSVPPLALPARRFALVEAVPPVQARHYEDVPTWRSDPPPTQRFCSLLI